MTIKSRRDLARALRRRATEAEKELWRRLRAELPLEKTYFRRQVPIGPYVVDFACFRYRLVIELDGSQHGTAAGLSLDGARTQDLLNRGFKVLRFWNHQVFTQIGSVLDTIQAELRCIEPVYEAADVRHLAPESEGDQAAVQNTNTQHVSPNRPSAGCSS